MSDDPLEALEAAYEGEEEVLDEEDLGEQDDSYQVDDEQQDDESDSAPPGYMTYEKWIEEGNDPDLYKGKKAYEAEYKRIQEVKELKSSVKGLGDTLRSTVEAIAERERKAEERHRKELEAAIARAKEDGDAEGLADAYEQLSELQAKPTPPVKPKTHPVISDFLSKNPVLNDGEVHDEFARIYNGKLRADGVGPSDQLSEAAIKGYARATLERIKEVYPERFASPRNTRPAPVRTKTTAAPKADIGQRIKGVKIDSISPQNRHAASEIYEMVKAANPAVAETFAKNVLGE